MPEYSLTCPGCHKKYKLKADSISSLMSKTFNCPQCGFSVPFTMIITQKTKDSALKTCIAAPHVDSHETHIAGQKTRFVNHFSNAKVGLQIEKTGKQFELQPGIYILGRDSQDSTATLRVAADPYMSRQHARLVIGITNGIVTCHLSCLSPSNPVYVNKSKLVPGDSVLLKSQDRILLGMTTLIYTQN